MNEDLNDKAPKGDRRKTSASARPHDPFKEIARVVLAMNADELRTLAKWSGDVSDIKNLEQFSRVFAANLFAAVSRHAQSKLCTTEPNELDPPNFAEFLLIAFSSLSRGDAMIGDLNEHFDRECEKLGRRRAVWRYWARTLRSLWPLLWRKAVKWGALIAALKRLF
jgi:hypothetical protein